MITDVELNSIVIISGLTMMTLIVIYHAISSTFEQEQWVYIQKDGKQEEGLEY